MSDGKFSVFTISYVNTALNQSTFRSRKCYIINANNTICDITLQCDVTRIIFLSNKVKYFEKEQSYNNLPKEVIFSFLSDYGK